MGKKSSVLLFLFGSFVVCGLGGSQTEQCELCKCATDDSTKDRVIIDESSLRITKKNPVFPLERGYELEYMNYMREGSREIIEFSLSRDGKTLCTRNVDLIGEYCNFCYCDKNGGIIISAEFYVPLYKAARKSWPALFPQRVWQIPDD